MPRRGETAVVPIDADGGRPKAPPGRSGSHGPGHRAPRRRRRHAAAGRDETAVVPIDADGGRPTAPPGRSGNHGHRQHRSSPPPAPPQEFRPFRRWFPFLVPLFIAVNIALFVLIMYVNECPAHAPAAAAAISYSVGRAAGVSAGAAAAQGCMLEPELGRYAFQPYKENPLVGPTSVTLPP